MFVPQVAKTNVRYAVSGMGAAPLQVQTMNESKFSAPLGRYAILHTVSVLLLANVRGCIIQLTLHAKVTNVVVFVQQEAHMNVGFVACKIESVLLLVQILISLHICVLLVPHVTLRLEFALHLGNV